MNLGAADVAHVLAALAGLLAAAHVFGFLAVKLRQPRVIGEIAGGFVLGPAVLGALAPGLHAALLPAGGPTAPVLGAVYQLGLLLLMFCSGAQMRAVTQPGERRVTLAITAAGTVVPFVAALGFVAAWDTHAYLGPAQHHGAFVLVFAIALAVTSIPVISRIMLDLGVLDSSFARVVLGAAVLEDILLYVVLSVALGLAGAGREAPFGLPALLGLDGASLAAGAYHLLASAGLLALSLLAGGRLFRWAVGLRVNVLHRASPVGSLLVYLLLATGVALFLGVAPMLGAFLAGMAAGRSGASSADHRAAVESFAFAFFVPLYFALVGFKIDLHHDFDPAFFAAFLACACVAKAAAVYLGARTAREPHRVALNLAMAMNARGGPAIVLASVAFDAGIIDAAFYTDLIVLAVVTSSLAGAWLGREVRAGRPLR